MNNRLLKLIKQDLIEYVHFALGSVTFIFASWVLGRVINMIFDFGDNGFFVTIFHTASFGAATIIMFISGIVAGAEVPAGVRRGISRVESFISESTSALIVSVLIGPFLLAVAMILQLLPRATTFIAHWTMGMFLVQFLMYIAAFFCGMFIAFLWQRIGWLLTMILVVMTVFVTGWLGIRTAATNISIDHLDVNLDNLGYVIEYVVENVVEGNQFLLAQTHDSNVMIFATVATILFFGTGAYLLIKQLPVKTR
ncbi:MAG: hypothetical protein FWE07_02630 [Turicibacter sp.]|nr:hypothetical protein [Turicibacter sp.]